MKNTIFDCLIIGGGPAGLSCALYCARGNVSCGIIDNQSLGGTPINYCEIENYLGFSKIQGYELCENFINHLNNFDVQKFEYEEIESIDLLSPIKKIKTSDKEYLCKTIVIATGAKSKKLGIKGEIENIGRGVSYCAVCDGAFYKDKTVAVVGGGNSALEEALYLTKFASKVYLIHRRNEFRADKIIQEKVKNNSKIELVLNSTVSKIIADKKVESIDVIKNNEKINLKIDGIFPYIGLEPNSELFNGQILQDKNGFIITDEKMKTNADGVFCIGDIRTTPLRQVITAVADGAVAGVEVAKYIEENKEVTNESISLR